MFEGIKEKLTQPIGPLPAFAWVIVVVGGYFGYEFLKNRSGSSSSTTATTVGATDTSGAVAPSSSDYAALTSQVSTLGNQITDLGGKIAGLSPTAPVGLANNPTQLQQWANDPTIQNPVINPILTAATTVQTVGTTATHALSTPAPMPVFSNNTATPTPVSAAIAPVAAPVIQAIRTVSQAGATSQDVIMGTQGTVPTFSQTPVPSLALSIPATTPTVTTAPATIVAAKPAVQTVRTVVNKATKSVAVPTKGATVRVA